MPQDRKVSRLRRVTAAVLIAALASACETPRPPPPASSLDFPGAQRIELPDVLGVPVAVVAPELPQGALPEGGKAAFDIEFTVDVKGQVTASKIVASSDPRLDATVLEQHRRWLYAVATRDRPCSAAGYRGLQRFEVTRRDGKLGAEVAPARVLEVLSRGDRPNIQQGAVRVPNYRAVMSRAEYPVAARRAGVEAKLALLVEFGADGVPTDVYPVNSAYDKWGFAAAGIQVARRLRAESDLGRPFTACLPITFLLRP